MAVVRITARPVKGGRPRARLRVLVAVAFGVAVLPLVSGSASGDTATFSNPTRVATPRGGPPPGCPNFDPVPNGCADIAVPYPSPISVAGMQGTITDVDVTLTGLWNNAFGPNDFDIMLVSPAGTGVMLMSDACGVDSETSAGDVPIEPDNAITVTFDDEAAEQLPADASVADPCVSGTFRPVDDEDSNFFVSRSDEFYGPITRPRGTNNPDDPGERGPRPMISNSESTTYTTPNTTLLSAFDGQDPNGTWSLYVVDDWPTDSSESPSGAIEGGWSLQIVTSTTPTAPPTTAGSTTTTAPRPTTSTTTTSTSTTTTVVSDPTVGSSGTGDPYFPLQGNGGYDVGHYDVSFSYDPPTNRMDAGTRITATATQDLSQFNLDFTGLMVRGVLVNGAVASFRQEGQELVVTPATTLPSGRAFTVLVAYHGNPSYVVDPDGTREGWMRTDDGAYVANAPQGAMTWFPGNHNLLDKATHTFKITVPEGTTAIANGALVSTTSVSGRTTFVWNSTEPMANYLSTATIGRFNMTSTRTPIGTNYLAIDPTIAPAPSGPVAQTPSIVAGLSAMFGPYPFSVSGGIVDNAQFVGYAVETQTKPIYPWQPDQRLVVHELAHQWFGNSVTITTWRDIWLSEGLASYAEWLWDERNGGLSAQQVFDFMYAQPADDVFWRVPPGDPGAQNLFHSAVYRRGAMTLHVLRTTVGDRTFSYILRAWASEHRHGHGTTEQFIELAERFSGRQLDALFQRWLYQPGKPAFP